jgi:membrane-associated phospholipid phosphatase
MTIDKTTTARGRTRRDSGAGTTVLGVLTELGFLGAGVASYLAVRWYTLGSTDEAISNTGDVLRLERLLGLDWEHTVQDATLAVPGLGPFLTQIYVWGYLPALVGITLWLHVRHREAYTLMRNALLASGALGLVVYAVYPCAPPWIGGGGGGFTDTVAEGYFASVARPPGIANHLGAIPSFHVGWVMLAGVVVFRVASSRTLRVLCVVYPALMAYAVISTGNHWVLDIPAGAALAAVGLLVATLLPRPRDEDALDPIRSSASRPGAAYWVGAGVEARARRRWLPRLDSNQQPSG